VCVCARLSVCLEQDEAVASVAWLQGTHAASPVLLARPAGSRQTDGCRFLVRTPAGLQHIYQQRTIPWFGIG
jgi:hypothetical protein